MLKDSEWATIDGEACLVTKFTPAASVQNGRIVSRSISTPYASLSLECKSGVVEGHVTHKVDFLNLWIAFNVRGVAANEEVIVIWTRKYKYSFLKYISGFLPKLWIMICPKGASKLMHNPNLPDFTWSAIKPITEYKPEIIEE